MSLWNYVFGRNFDDKTKGYHVYYNNKWVNVDLDGNCHKCKSAPKTFSSTTEKTNYIMNEFLYSVIKEMNPISDDQRSEIKTEVMEIVNFSDFLPRLKIVLKNVSDWDSKINLLHELRCCHTNSSELDKIAFEKLNLFDKRSVIRFGIEHWPESFYRTKEDYTAHTKTPREKPYREAAFYYDPNEIDPGIFG